MNRCALSLGLFVFISNVSFGAIPKLPGVGTAIQEMVTKNEIAGAVTVVVSPTSFCIWRPPALRNRVGS
jgi:hypothetical protein